MNGRHAGRRLLLRPGEYHACRETEVTLSTLLGSCVAVCLYDPVRRVFGMNHFLLAHRRHARDLPLLDSEAGRYGIHAMELLIDELLKLGGERFRLRAKAFGGANVLGLSCDEGDDFTCVGTLNVRFVRAFLDKSRIPLVAADLGGCAGRQIHFTGRDFSVYVRRVAQERARTLVQEERVYWRQSLGEQGQGGRVADLR